MPAYSVDLAGPVVRAVESGEIPVHIVDALMQLMDGDLAEVPKKVGKPLRAPFESCWSAHIGPYYRAIYTIDDRLQKIKVVAVKQRKDAYRA